MTDAQFDLLIQIIVIGLMVFSFYSGFKSGVQK